MRHKSGAIRAALVTVLAGTVLGGCGLSSSDKSQEAPAVDITMKEAAQKADAMLDGTMAAFVPEVEWTNDRTTAGDCDLIRYRTVMTIISEQRRGNFLGVTERFWKKSGYKIVSVNKDKEHPAIFARSADGFAISVTIGDRGQAFFEVATPCVRESEIPDPVVRANGQDYSHDEVPYPNVRSRFWSAGSPVSGASAGSSSS
ncbi:hypothetical protein [Streptomyces qinzhouensis]|uniref:Lipoprotein n=1 Tax=Streptomyces qinzhouensis TaxID=2599401 RepID=A0A5B8JBT8_9ACTN|nr:hypothetical protein [Streptomyces qinzhouensis]QDY77361.1 hypothetical protein FQU76_13445 [Streptomyces qinzhouensis]